MPWPAAGQVPRSFTVSRSLLKFMSIESVMLSIHFILCSPILLLPLIFPSIRAFQMSQFFPSGGQSIGVSASASVPPVNIQDWFLSGWTVWNLFDIRGTLKSLLQHHSPKASTLWCSAFFMVQLSHPYMTARKNIALTIGAFVSKVRSLLFNMLSNFIIAFLSRSKHFFLIER